MFAKLETQINKTDLPENFRELPLKQKLEILWPIIEIILLIIKSFAGKKKKALVNEMLVMGKSDLKMDGDA